MGIQKGSNSGLPVVMFVRDIGACLGRCSTRTIFFPQQVRADFKWGCDPFDCVGLSKLDSIVADVRDIDCA